MKKSLCVLVVALFAYRLFGQGMLLWDESVNGPLSEDYTQPTSLGNLLLGTNSVIGSVSSVFTGTGYAAHDDYFTFTVQPGNSLAGVYISVNKPTLVWLGNPSFSTMIGQVFNPLNGEVLSQMGLGPLTSGTFGMYLANNEFVGSSSTSNYRLDFLVQSIPEPDTFPLIALGAAALLIRSRQNKSKSRV